MLNSEAHSITPQPLLEEFGQGQRGRMLVQHWSLEALVVLQALLHCTDM